MWNCRQESTTTCRCNLAQIRQAGKDGFSGLHASCRLLHGERGGAGSMSTLFAFLHHVAAFTLVSALAVEFILIGQELSLATAPGVHRCSARWFGRYFACCRSAARILL